MQVSNINPRLSCHASFRIFYGIGNSKATRLNSFLLNHPIQKKFLVNFQQIIFPTNNFDMWKKIPRDAAVRLSVENHLRQKMLTFCYSTYRLFQNLPSKGRTKANANCIHNFNPYKALKVNLPFYQNLEVAYKKRELLNNERFDELNAYVDAENQKEKMKKEDRKQKTQRSREDFLKKQKTKK